jgi:ubiquinone/menaquinone biosynthesis C-methylase UbiE
MKMTRFEKRFVNRKRKAKRNIEKLCPSLKELDIQNVSDALELGCGIGVVSAFLVETYGWNMYGTDFDHEQIEIARKINQESDHLHYSVEDAAHLNFKDASFDLVLSQMVFHHIPDWETAVREVARVLRPQGYFVWHDFAFSKIIKAIFQPFTKNYGLYTFVEIKSAFLRNGFDTRSYERAMHGPFTNHNLVLKKS